jgi:hypothetical protein
MDECIDSLGTSRIFSTLDCNSGYWQIPVHREDKNKTAYTSHERFYSLCWMAFGLTTAPVTFQMMMMILAGLTWMNCLFYLNDIVIFSASFEEHVLHLDQVLERLYLAGLSQKLPKCRPGQLAVAEEHTAALSDAKPPRTQSELRPFLGLCNVYRRFLPGSAEIAGLLRSLPRTGESPRFEDCAPKQLGAPILHMLPLGIERVR